MKKANFAVGDFVRLVEGNNTFDIYVIVAFDAPCPPSKLTAQVLLYNIIRHQYGIETHHGLCSNSDGWHYVKL